MGINKQEKIRKTRKDKKYKAETQTSDNLLRGQSSTEIIKKESDPETREEYSHRRNPATDRCDERMIKKKTSPDIYSQNIYPPLALLQLMGR